MNIKFILDTTVLSELSKSQPNTAVLEFINEAEYMIAAGTLMEIQYGIAKLSATNPAKADRLNTWYDEIVLSGTQIIETGPEVARVWGKLASDTRLNNLRIHHAGQHKFQALQDLHIAAAAIECGAVVATIDVDDFMLIHRCHPLPGVFNPATGRWHAGDLVRAYLRASVQENSLVRKSLSEFLDEYAANDDVAGAKPEVEAMR
jgi:predicted nucleic acid-binding protein